MTEKRPSECYADDFRNNCIQTFTGRQVFPFRPEDSEVVIEDIAHALSMTCRFTGHVQKFYSVAQHSILVAELVPVEHALAGLLHDASEAYLCDLPSPVKAGLPEYKQMEERVHERVCEVFGLPYPHHPVIKWADIKAVATESRDLMPNPPTLWRIPGKPLAGVKVDPWSSERAEKEFLDLYRELTTTRKS